MRYLVCFFCALAPVSALAGCASVPAEGASTQEILTEDQNADYAIVMVNERLAELLGRPDGGGGGAQSSPRSVAPPSGRLGIGDELAIRILEAGREAHFLQGSMTGRSGSFSAVTVGPHGSITLRHVGALAVSGMTPGQIEAEIVRALRDRVIEPQAIVSVTKAYSNSITLNGVASMPGVYRLTLRQTWIAEAKAMCGGSAFPDYETRVTLIRTGRSASSRLDRVLLEPTQNVFLLRGDEIVFSHEPETYTITRAVSRSGALSFNAASISLLEAVSGAGGLNDAHRSERRIRVPIRQVEPPARGRRAGARTLRREPAGDPDDLPGRHARRVGTVLCPDIPTGRSRRDLRCQRRPRPAWQMRGAAAQRARRGHRGHAGCELRAGT